jgi:AcrR family transcriptional regulator
MPLTRRTELSRERVVASALQLLDDEGVDALSMRRLAEVLGVGTMSIYHYVADKAELTEAVTEVVLGDLPYPPPEAGWVETSRLLGLAYRRLALAHPAAFQLVIVREPSSSQLARWRPFEASVKQAGISAEDTRMLFRAVTRFVVGWCLIETAELPLRTRADRRAGGDEDFVVALDALLDGLQRRVRTAPRP